MDSVVGDGRRRYRDLAGKDSPIILAVNKYDLEDRKISVDDIKEYSDYFDEFLFTSAKDGRNVEYIFKLLASKVAYSLKLSISDTVDIIKSKKIEQSIELLDSLLALSSEIEKMPHETREKLLEESGISKFNLDEEMLEIDEDEVLAFGKKLAEWNIENDNEYAANQIRQAVGKYILANLQD